MNEFTGAQVGMVKEDFTNLCKLSLDMVWSNLKSMSVVNTFNQCGISKHPSMNSSQVYFVLKMAQNNNIRALERKVLSQERTIQELKDLVAAQATSLASLEGKMQSVESRADRAFKAAGVSMWGEGENTPRGGRCWRPSLRAWQRLSGGWGQS